MGMGHSGAAQAIIALVISTAFLVWLGGKAANPNQRIGKLVAWVAIVLSALLVIGSIVMCAKMCSSGMCERKGGMGMMQKMHQGMGMGMGMPQMPPPQMQEKK